MNKYRVIDPVQAAAYEISRNPEPVRLRPIGGMVLGTPARDLDLARSPDLDKVRVEFGGLQADFDVEIRGDPPTGRIVALGEHRFVLPGGEIFNKIFRMYPGVGGFATLESWDGDAWVLEHLSEDIIITDQNLAWKSIHNIIFFAPDSLGRVFKWDNSNIGGNDFASENRFGAYFTPNVVTTITPAAAVDDLYEVHYSLTIRGQTIQDGSVTIAVLVNGEEAAVKTHVIPASWPSISELIELPHEVISFTRQLNDGDIVAIGIKESTSFSSPAYSDEIEVTDEFRLQAESLYLGGRAASDVFSVNFELEKTNPAAIDVTVGFYVTYEPIINDNWILIAEDTYSAAGAYVLNDLLGAPVAVTADPVAFRLILGPEAAGGEWRIAPELAPPFDAPIVLLNRQEGLFIQGHGFNLAVDEDPAQGVTYRSTDDIVNSLIVVERVPGEDLFGTQLGVFANRLLVLQAGKDAQTIAWSANGFPSIFISALELEEEANPDANLTIHGDEAAQGSDSDPIDELMAFGRISSNVGVLFRRQSLMRVVPTGRAVPALAFYPWIEELGTESPFSVTIVPGGLIFLGNDRQVYYLTEAGPLPIGTPIYESFRAISDESLALVEGVYDTRTQSFIITLPSGTLEIG